jgi:hypothetical protein
MKKILMVSAMVVFASLSCFAENNHAIYLNLTPIAFGIYQSVESENFDIRSMGFDIGYERALGKYFSFMASAAYEQPIAIAGAQLRWYLSGHALRGLFFGVGAGAPIFGDYGDFYLSYVYVRAQLGWKIFFGPGFYWEPGLIYYALPFATDDVLYMGIGTSIFSLGWCF